MNRKQFLILLVLLVVLGGAGLLLRKNQDIAANTGEQGAGQKLLGDKFPINDVAHLVIKHGTNELNLVKKDDRWRVRERSDYAANFTQIGDFLLKAAELKVVQSDEVAASELARLELTPPGPATNSGILVELKDKDDKTLKSLTLGKKHVRKSAQMSQFGDEGFPDGRYLLAGTDTKHALLVSDALLSIEAKPENWIKKDFFKIERPKAISVTYAAATNSWKLVRDTETGDWKLADAKAEEKLDATKVSGVTAPFASPSLNDVALSSAKPADYGLDQPTTVAVETFDDFAYTVTVGKKVGEDYALTVAVVANFPKERTPGKDEKPEDKDKADKAFKDRQKTLEDKLKEAKNFEQWIYLVPSWSVDPVLKNRKDLFEEKKDETKPADPGAPTAPGAPVLLPPPAK